MMPTCSGSPIQAGPLPPERNPRSRCNTDRRQSLQIPLANPKPKEEPMKTNDFLAKLGRLTRGASDDVSHSAQFDLLQPQCAAPLRMLCESVLNANPESRLWLRAVAKKLARSSPQLFTNEENSVLRGLGTGDSGLGQAVSLPEPLSADIYSLLLQYSAFRTLGVVPMTTGKTKLAMVSGKPTAIWITPANQGTTIPTDAAITGTSISPEASTVAALVEVSGEALNDGKVTFEAALLMALIEGLGSGIDWAAFRGTGADDAASGTMTGIFSHADVPVFTATGHASIPALTFNDFADCIGEVTPSALAILAAGGSPPISSPRC